MPASGRTGSGRPARSWNWSVDPWMWLAVVILLPSRVLIYAAFSSASSIHRRFFRVSILFTARSPGSPGAADVGRAYARLRAAFASPIHVTILPDRGEHSPGTTRTGDHQAPAARGDLAAAERTVLTGSSPVDQQPCGPSHSTTTGPARRASRGTRRSRSRRRGRRSSTPRGSALEAGPGARAGRRRRAPRHHVGRCGSAGPVARSRGWGRVSPLVLRRRARPGGDVLVGVTSPRPSSLRKGRESFKKLCRSARAFLPASSSSSSVPAASTAPGSPRWARRARRPRRTRRPTP